MEAKSFWIARDMGDVALYNVSSKKMRKITGDFFLHGEIFCPDEFERITGIKLKPGDQEEFRLVRTKI